MTVNQYGLPPTASPTHSTYWRQLERIAPPLLLDRGAELAELADFCLDERRGPYVWWQAGPWAGKSALLSTFVLDARRTLVPSRVWVVSFFITARLASQDTRDAFVSALTEQLSALLNRDLPAAGCEAARETTLLDLFDQAAAACRQAGGRLVLVIDGLDEDQGMTTGPAAHSIAGLLPGSPPAGMRIIVAGRPNPPIPDDVPDWHPLRDPGIIRLLSDSPHAQNVQRLSQAELKRLLQASPLEQELLGLLTAARGGLSGTDLRELTGVGLAFIEEILHTVAGRTFSRRLPAWGPDDRPLVYLLGHEELHSAAVHYIGPRRLSDYRNQLNAWADTYRSPVGGPPWPVHTPGYLLTGYASMLGAIGDLARFTELALDPARHDRMLDLSGGDTAALTEIRACQDLLLNRPQPDLRTLGRLSHHRNQLEVRGANIPIRLPALWATIGQIHRAEVLADTLALAEPIRHSRGLVFLVKAVAAEGDVEYSIELITRAERIARTITTLPLMQAYVLTELVEAVADAGETERREELIARAEDIAWTIAEPEMQHRALASLVEPIAVAGQNARAEQIARLLDPNQQVAALAGLVRAAATEGDTGRARALIARAEQIARTIARPEQQVRELTKLTKAAAVAGEVDWARTLTDMAEQAAQRIAGADEQARALIRLIEVADGDKDRARDLISQAEQITRTIDQPRKQVEVLTDLVKAAAVAREVDRARALADQIDRITRTITSAHDHEQAQLDWAEAAAAAGDIKRAEQIIVGITDPTKRAYALVDLGMSVAATGKVHLARELAARAEQLARSITRPGKQDEALTGLLQAAAAAGKRDWAEQLALTIPNQGWKTQELVVRIRGWRARAATESRSGKNVGGVGLSPAQKLLEQEKQAAAEGDASQAYSLIARAEERALAMSSSADQARALVAVANTASAAGQFVTAERIASTLTNPNDQAQVLVAATKAAAEAGQFHQAERIARTFSDRGHEAWGLLTATQAAVAAGHFDEAERIAKTLRSPVDQSQALASAGRAAASAGRVKRAGELAAQIEMIATSDINPGYRDAVLVSLTEAVAAAGETDRVEEIARTIIDRDQQARALTRAAEAVGMNRAGPWLGRAFALGHWLIPLQAVAKWYPEQAVQIVDALFRIEQRNASQ